MSPSISSADRRRAYLYLAVTTSIWGSLYIVTRIALETVPPITLLFFRYAIASVALLALTRAMKKCMVIRREDRKYFLFIGAVGYFASARCSSSAESCTRYSLAATGRWRAHQTTPMRAKNRRFATTY